MYPIPPPPRKNLWKSRSKNQQESEKVAAIFVRKSREKIATRYNAIPISDGFRAELDMWRNVSHAIFAKTEVEQSSTALIVSSLHRGSLAAVRTQTELASFSSIKS
jgi:hypothetical protein